MVWEDGAPFTGHPSYPILIPNSAVEIVSASERRFCQSAVAITLLPVELVDITAIVEFADEMGVPKRQRIVTGDVGIAPNR